MRPVDLHDTTFATHHVGDVVHGSDATGRSNPGAPAVGTEQKGVFLYQPRRRWSTFELA